MRRLIIILSTIFLIQTAAKAQYYQTGVEPGYTKWRQIESGKIRVIYPSEYEDKASSYLNLLLTTDSLTGRDYNLKSKRIDVVLHPNSMLSNGFVAWAPRRMELITFPATVANLLYTRCATLSKCMRSTPAHPDWHTIFLGSR